MATATGNGAGNLRRVALAALAALASVKTALFGAIILGWASIAGTTCSIVGHLLIGAGCQIVSLANDSLQYTLGMCCIAVGGRGVSSSLFHVANLFPERKFFIVSLLNGATNISFCVLALFDWLWGQFGVSLHTLFCSFTLLALTSAVISWFSWPDEPFQESHSVNSDEAQPLLHNKQRPTPGQDLVEPANNCFHIS